MFPLILYIFDSPTILQILTEYVTVQAWESVYKNLTKRLENITAWLMDNTVTSWP